MWVQLRVNHMFFLFFFSFFSVCFSSFVSHGQLRSRVGSLWLNARRLCDYYPLFPLLFLNNKIGWSKELCGIVMFLLIEPLHDPTNSRSVDLSILPYSESYDMIFLFIVETTLLWRAIIRVYFYFSPFLLLLLNACIFSSENIRGTLKIQKIRRKKDSSSNM